MTTIADPKVQQRVIENVMLLPNGGHTMNKDVYYEYWYAAAAHEIAKGNLPDHTLEDLEEDDDGETIDTIIKQTYDLYIKHKAH